MQKRHWYFTVLLGFFFFCSSLVFAQDSGDNMQTLLQSKNYTFTAQYAQPLSGKQISLTTFYTVTIRHDSLICDLPYYGVAYIAPMDPSKNDLHFTSTHYDYNVQPAKRGRFVVTIKINDRTAVQQMYLSVSKKGFASLQVTPTNKQAISYYGKVDEIMKAK